MASKVGSSGLALLLIWCACIVYAGAESPKTMLVIAGVMEDCISGPEPCCGGFNEFLGPDHLCQSAEGCFLDSYCNGSSSACPPRQVQPSGHECRAATGCAYATKCDGTSGQCPTPPYKSGTTRCRNATRPCEMDTFCSGYGTECPEYAPYAPDTTICRNLSCAQIAYCLSVWYEYECPPEERHGSSVLCRAAEHPCEANTYCTGVSSECPESQPLGQEAICRTSTTPCELDTHCNGETLLCPDVEYQPSDTVCAKADLPCTTDAYCTGNSPTCPPPPFLPNGTLCDYTDNPCYAGYCDGRSTTCFQNQFLGLGATCGTNSLCAEANNNTCDAKARCMAHECTSCHNKTVGEIGADCTCRINPPALTSSSSSSDKTIPLDSRCMNGIWFVHNKHIEGSLEVFPGSRVVFLGTVTISTGRSLILGDGSYTNMSQCTTITGDITGKGSPGYRSSLTSLVYNALDCSKVEPSHIRGTLAANLDKCTKLVLSKQPAKDGYAALMFSTVSICRKRLNYMIIVAPILSICGLIALALIVLFVIYRFKTRSRYEISTDYYDGRYTMPMASLSRPLMKEDEINS